LHAPGKDSVERAGHLKDVKVPMLFLQGTRDTLAVWDLIESVVSSLSRAKLVRIEGANHSFKAGKENNIDVLAKATTTWIEKIIKK
jgi:predicted alpha/beta-hydrolase family hydrolase